MSAPTPTIGREQVAPHPFRVELTGKLAALTFPDCCANCTAPTADRTPIRKVFPRYRRSGSRRRSNRFRGYVIDSARVPYCPRCLAQDERERQPLAERWRARLGSLTLSAIPAVPCIAFGLYWETVVLHSGASREAGWGWMDALGMLFLGWGMGLVAVAWHESRRHLIPRQTSVTLAFDFSEDVADLLDPGERRVYTARESRFAEAFTALNRERLWLPDPAAERMERRVWITCAVFLAAAALAALLLNR